MPDVQPDLDSLCPHMPWGPTFHEKVLHIFEPAHDKTYNKTCTTSEDSDQTAHPRSLIRVFADRMCLVYPPGYPKRDEQKPLPYWVDVQANPSLCLLHRSYCRFCGALAHLVEFQPFCFKAEYLWLPVCFLEQPSGHYWKDVTGFYFLLE